MIEPRRYTGLQYTMDRPTWQIGLDVQCGTVPTIPFVHVLLVPNPQSYCLTAEVCLARTCPPLSPGLQVGEEASRLLVHFLQGSPRRQLAAFHAGAASQICAALRRFATSAPPSATSASDGWPGSSSEPPIPGPPPMGAAGTDADAAGASAAGAAGAVGLTGELTGSRGREGRGREGAGGRRGGRGGEARMLAIRSLLSAIPLSQARAPGPPAPTIPVPPLNASRQPVAPLAGNPFSPPWSPPHGSSPFSPSMPSFLSLTNPWLPAQTGRMPSLVGRKRGAWWREGEGGSGVSEEGNGGEGEGGGYKVMVRRGLLLQSLAELCSSQEGVRRHVYELNVSTV